MCSSDRCRRGQAHNNTFETFSDANLLSVNQRGFATFLNAEAGTFLHAHQVRLNATVAAVHAFEGGPGESGGGVSVVLADGTELRADHALCTFSLGVLQHDDVVFDPPLPAWKREAIHSMSMVRPPYHRVRQSKSSTLRSLKSG